MFAFPHILKLTEQNVNEDVASSGTYIDNFTQPDSLTSTDFHFTEI